jgi:hypothetical protein
MGLVEEGIQANSAGSGIYGPLDVPASGFFGCQPFGQGPVQVKKTGYPADVVGKGPAVGGFYGLVRFLTGNRFLSCRGHGEIKPYGKLIV